MSQDNAAMCLRCGGIFIFNECLPEIYCQDCRWKRCEKSVSIWQS